METFYNCYYLKSIEVPEGVECIGDRCFYHSAIEEIKLPPTLKMLKKGVFYDCKNLKHIEIPNGVEHIGKECFLFSEIEEITLPSTLKEIDENALSLCFNLKTVFVEKGCAVDVKKHVREDIQVIYK